MNYLNGGYVMIKHNATQKDLAAAYKSNRPVLVYDENQKAHWAQINETVTTETIDDEVVTTYTYSYQILNDIASLVDSAGNNRFIEGDLEVSEITGVTFTYSKWSLSGTHLMIVIAFDIDNGTVLGNDKFAEVKLPTWILSKIYPSYLTNTVEVKGTNIYDTSWGSQFMNIKLIKRTEYLEVQCNAITLSSAKSGRIQFDLLIDAEYTE